MNSNVAIETTFNSASPFSVQMAQIAEPELTRLTFENTANAASALGVVGGAVWPEYALGMGFRRFLKSMPLAPAQSPPYPLFQNSEYINPGEGCAESAAWATLTPTLTPILALNPQRLRLRVDLRLHLFGAHWRPHSPETL